MSPWVNAVWVVAVIGVPVMIVHELVHIAMASMLGVKVKAVGITWRGMYTRRESGDDVQNLVITMSAPMFNLFLALVSCQHSSWFAHNFFAANFCFFIFNTLPLPFSDGRRAWDCIRRLRDANKCEC